MAAAKKDDLKAKFETAAATAKQTKKKPDNATLLKLYSYYKQATEGDAKGEAAVGAYLSLSGEGADRGGRVAGWEEVRADPQRHEDLHGGEDGQGEGHGGNDPSRSASRVLHGSSTAPLPTGISVLR